jgi:hypothetical protein
MGEWTKRPSTDAEPYVPEAVGLGERARSGGEQQDQHEEGKATERIARAPPRRSAGA